MKPMHIYDEDSLGFESISVINIKYEQGGDSFYSEYEDSDYVDTSISQIDPDDYLCESFVLLKSFLFE